MSDCLPQPADAATAACIASRAAPYLDDIDEHCAGPGTAPDGCGAEYPSTAAWDNLSHLWVATDISPTFCTE